MVYILTPRAAEGVGACSSEPVPSVFLIIEGIGLIMEEVCKNCECFVQRSLNSDIYLWGDCRKPTSGVEQIKGDRKAVFKWGDATCSDFKPKQEVEDEWTSDYAFEKLTKNIDVIKGAAGENEATTRMRAIYTMF